MDLISSDIMNASENFLPVSILSGLFCLAFYCWIRRYSNKMKRLDSIAINSTSLSRMVVMYAFCVYCFMVIAIVLLSREPGSRDAVRLQLFSVFSKDICARTFGIENILLFLPFGFMLPIIWNRFNSFKWCTFAGFLSSVTIEVVQHITKRGFSELDDILNNSLGTMLGYGIFLAVKVTVNRLIRILQRD